MTDPTEQALRRVLDAEAAAVPVSADALDLIRRGIAAGHRRRRHTRRGGIMIGIGTGTATALVAATVIVLAGTGSCLGPPAPHQPPASAPGGTGTPSATPGGTPSPTPSGSAAPAPAVPTGPSGSPPAGMQWANLPVYYPGATRNGPRLYREYHKLYLGIGTAAKVRAAVTEMLHESAYDLDYTSPWPAGAAVRGVSVSGGVVTVDLTGARSAIDPALARAAVDQIVWTATAASGAGGVRLLFDGSPASTLWGVPVAGTLSRRAAVEVLAPIWLVDPQQGATLGRTFTVRMAGFVFEGQGNLRIRAADGRVVLERAVHYTQGAPAQGEASVTVTVPAGRYTVTAYDVSERDGSEIDADDHDITVR